MISKRFQLSREDKNLANKILSEQYRQKKHEGRKKEYEKRKLEVKIDNAEDLYTNKDEKKIDKKYKRKKYDIEKKDLSKYAVKSELRNLKEQVLKVKWESQAQHDAELKLTETEVMRTSTVKGGIQLDDDDVFSSTNQLAQEDVVKSVDLNSKKKIFDIELTKSGPYKIAYTQSGRHILAAGQKGHSCVLEWRKFSKVSEIEFSDSVSDACWMMDNTMYALAQGKSTYVYDIHGVELHKCDFQHAKWLDYLPYHFLLAGVNPKGHVYYKDISVGKNVGSVITGLETSSMTRNPWNSLMILGHLNGTVSMVTPRDEPHKPVISMLCHKAPISHCVVDPTGVYMVTSGIDKTLRVWDIRNTFKYLADIELPEPIYDLEFSQKGCLAVGFQSRVSIWGKHTDLAKEPYMNVALPTMATLKNIAFCPFEDVMGIGHSRGVSSALIPGSGEATFDSRVPNPFSTEKHIADWNVRALLEKIPSDMIALDPTIIGTSGQRAHDYRYNKNVKIDDGLKKNLKSLGIVEAEQKPKTREELIEVIEEKEDKLKEMRIGKEWWKKKGTTALDRFATGKIQRVKPEMKRIQMVKVEKKQVKKQDKMEETKQEPKKKVKKIKSTVIAVDDQEDDLKPFSPFVKK